MIKVTISKRDFEYDIYSLLREFYPGEEVVVDTEEGFAENGTDKPEDIMLKISVFYGLDSIRMTLAEKDGDPIYDRSIEVEYEKNRRETKSAVKEVLYRILTDYTGRQMPWGDLTGIRPAKIAMELLDAGMSNAEAASVMRDKYFVSKEKTALAIMIANRERALLQEADYKNGYSLYVGIPFCPSICLYCSFSSSPLHIWKNRVDDYLDALCKEIDGTCDLYGGRGPDTIYIGGGTPTTLEPEQMDRLLTHLEKRFDYSRVREFTVEAGRPDTITREKLQVLRDHGISRISVNPQTMNQKTLDLIGRRHTVEETIEVYKMAREMGFDSINMDLIVGLPGEGLEEVTHTMEELAKLDPDNITVHSLALKRASRLNQMIEEYGGISFHNNAQIMDMTADSCLKAGLYPYYMYRQKGIAGNFENVGYARTDKAGLYNILIMEEVQSILALGAGASTKFVYDDGRIIRAENVKDIKGYIDRIDEMVERKKNTYEKSGS